MPQIERYGGNSLVPRRHVVSLLREAEYSAMQLDIATRSEQNTIRAIALVGEAAMADVAALKRAQREYEQLVPDASEALNLIATTAAMAIARRVARFGNDAP